MKWRPFVATRWASPPGVEELSKHGSCQALGRENAAIEGLVFRILSKARGLRRRSVDTCLARMLTKMGR